MTVDVVTIVDFAGSNTLTPLQFNLSSGGPMTGAGFATLGKIPEGKGLSDSSGKVNDGRPIPNDESELVSFKRGLVGRDGFPDMIRVGMSPLVPRNMEEVFFSSETGTRSVGTGFEGSRPNEELILPSGTGREVGRSLDLGSSVSGGSEELSAVTGIETRVDESVGFLVVSTGRAGAVAIDTSTPSEEIAETEEEVEKVVTDAASVVTFRIEYRRRKRTGVVVSIRTHGIEQQGNILNHPCHLPPRRRQISRR